MRIDVFIHWPDAPNDGEHLHSLLHLIQQKVDTIMATQAEQAARLRAFSAQLAKAKGEIVAAVDELKAAIETGGQSTPEVDEATNQLQDAVQGLDDLNPDVVTPPVEPPTI